MLKYQKITDGHYRLLDKRTNVVIGHADRGDGFFTGFIFGNELVKARTMADLLVALDGQQPTAPAPEEPELPTEPNSVLVRLLNQVAGEISTFGGGNTVDLKELP